MICCIARKKEATIEDIEMFTDYYKILGIDLYTRLCIIQNAIKEEEVGSIITTAWKKQAHINHPDKGGSVSLMKDINQAKECLILKENRLKYNLGYIPYLITQLDKKYPPTHIIGGVKYCISDVSTTGDGSFSNPFITGVKKTWLVDRWIM